MPFPSAALTAGNLTSLRGSDSTPPTYRSEQFISLCPNTTIFAARVNGTPSGASFAQVSYDTVTTGAFGDIQVGETVYISSTNDIRAAEFVGRVRKAPTSNILYINETSAPILDDWYIFVIYDFRAWDRLARYTGGVQYKDYDQTFLQLAPVIYNLQSAYAGVVSGSPSGFTVAFSASVIAATSGATISSYAWTIPTGGTVTAGATNTADVTVRFDAGFYWVKLIVTDSGNRTATRYIPVWSVPTDYSSQVALGFDGVSLTADDSGWAGQITGFTGLDSVYDNTLCVVWEREVYTGTEGSILSTVKFVGRLRTEGSRTTADDLYSTVQETAFELESVGSQMSRIEHLPFTLTNNTTTPTVWDDILNMTLWRAIVHCLQRHSTILELHSLSISDTSNTFLYDALPTSGGNILAIVGDIAESMNGRLEFAPTGELQLVRDARYLSTAARAALVTVIDYTSQDWIDLTLDIDHVQTVGRIDAAGGSYNSYSDKVLPVLSLAPGVAQNYPEATGQFTRQILAANLAKAAAQTELNERTGHHLAAENPTPRLTVSHPDGYNWLIPSSALWYTFTIAASDNTRGRAYTSSQRWLLRSVTITHDNRAGTKTVEAVYTLETSGTAGQTVNPPTQTANPVTIPQLPPFPSYPSFPPPPSYSFPIDTTGLNLPPLFGLTPPFTAPAPNDGNTVLIGTSTRLLVTREFIREPVPEMVDITPPVEDEGILHAVWSGFGTDVYCLVSDGTNSRVFYTDNALAAEPEWVASGTISGGYTVLSPASTPGTVYAYSPGGGTWSETFDFTVDDGGWTPNSASDDDGGVYVAATGWQHTDYINTNGSPDYGARAVNIILNTPGITIDSVTVNFDFTKGTYTTSSTGFTIVLNSTTVKSILFSAMVSGAGQSESWSGSQAGVTSILVNLRSSRDHTAPYSFSGAALITSITVTGTGTNPFSASGNATTVYSTDFGATFAAARTVGTSPGAYGGLATIPIGTVVLASASGQTAKATSGGVYASYGGAKAQGALWIPRYVFGSTSSANSGANPEYLLASSASDTGESLWKVTASGVTFTAITPAQAGVDGLAVSSGCIAMPWKSGLRMATILVYTATRRLKVTTDTGANWTDRGALSAEATYVRYRRGDTTLAQLFIADTDPYYSPNHGATLSARTMPFDTSTEPVKFIEPYG